MLAARMEKAPGIPYIAPFAVFVAFIALGTILPIPAALLYPLRFTLVVAVLLSVSRAVIPLRCSHWVGSVAMGLLVFLVWVAPDVLWPNYRMHWLFANPLTQEARSSIPEHLKSNLAFVALRVAGSVVLVPILEELFWRGWLMRWLIQPEFRKVRVGAYSAASFWLVAVLFASEHGPYWDVGLLAGILYNWWVIRTGSIADCILAHAVTNACLSAYVLYYHQWQYWL